MTWETLKWIPPVVVALLLSGLWLYFYLGAGKNEQAYDEEQDRQARVKALQPAPPSYEERMGVSYGGKG